MPRNQKVKPQGFEDGAENDLKNKTKQNKKTTNLKSTKPQLEYFDPLNNTVGKTESLKQKATSQNCKQYTTKRNKPPPNPTVNPVSRLQTHNRISQELRLPSLGQIQSPYS